VFDDDVVDDARTVSSGDGLTPANRGRLRVIDFVFVRRLPGFLLDAYKGGRTRAAPAGLWALAAI